MMRFGLFGALALLVNLLLFLLMSAIVRNNQMRLEESEMVSLVDLVHTREPEPPPPPTRRPPPPEPPEPVKPQPLPRPDLSPPPRPMPMRLPAPRIELNLALQMDGGPYIGDMLAPAAPAIISARELTPLVTLPPRYPPTARARRIEGFVEVEFTVDRNGGTSDIRVLAAEPAGVFERATEQAIHRWRFQAHVVEGKAVAVRATQRVDFHLGEP